MSSLLIMGITAGVGTVAGGATLKGMKKAMRIDKTITENTYKVMTSYFESLNINPAKMKEEDLAKMGINADKYDENKIHMLCDLFKKGAREKDYGSPLFVISHTEEEYDRRGEEEFQDAYQDIINKDKKVENYNEMAHALDASKLSKLIKKGEVSPNQILRLTTSALYTENLMKSAIPHIAVLQEAQNFFLVDGTGLNNVGQGVNDRKDIKVKDYNNKFLEKLGVLTERSDSLKNGLASRELSFEEAITGEGVQKKLLDSIREKDRKNITFDARNNLLSLKNERFLDDVGFKAQMVAGKQLYSVMLASLVKTKIGLMNPDEGLDLAKLSSKEQKDLEGILNLGKKESLSSAVKTVKEYASIMNGLINPESEQSKSFTYPFKAPDGSIRTVGQSIGELLDNLLEDQLGPEPQKGEHRTLLARRLNANCIQLGTYAEKDMNSFLQSLLVASSNESLGFKVDRELSLYDKDGQKGHLWNNGQDDIFSKDQKPLLPLTLVTDYGVYTTQVEYTKELREEIKSNSDYKYELLNTAIENISKTNPDANLRRLTTDNLFVGANPVFGRVMEKYLEQKDEKSELEEKVGEISASGKAGKGEEGKGAKTPISNKDLALYRQYKNEARELFRAFVVVPINGYAPEKQEAVDPLKDITDGKNIDSSTQTPASTQTPQTTTEPGDSPTDPPDTPTPISPKPPIDKDLVKTDPPDTPTPTPPKVKDSAQTDPSKSDQDDKFEQSIAPLKLEELETAMKQEEIIYNFYSNNMLDANCSEAMAKLYQNQVDTCSKHLEQLKSAYVYRKFEEDYSQNVFTADDERYVGVLFDAPEKPEDREQYIKDNFDILKNVYFPPAPDATQTDDQGQDAST